MKFGKELKLRIVQAWRGKYVRYDELKKKIKEIRQLYEDHNIQIRNEDFKPNAQMIPDPIQLDETVMQISNLHLGSRPAFLQSINGALKAETSLNSRIEFVADYNDDENKHDELYGNESNGSSASPFNKSSKSTSNLIKSNKNRAKYQLKGVTKIVQPNLSSKIPPFANNLQEIRSSEKEFVVLLEKDLVTVATFYAKQCEYFAAQHNNLIQKVQLFVKHEKDFQEQLNNKKNKESEYLLKKTSNTSIKSHQHQNDANKDDDVDDDSDESSLATDDGHEDSENATNRIPTVSRMDTLKQELKFRKEAVITRHDINEEKSYLRLLFRQIYNAVRMLEQYRKINETAFYKITKKHDKNSGKFRNLRNLTQQLIVNKCNFGNDYYIQFIQQRLEYLYSLYLKPEQQKRSEAIERLRAPPSTKQIQTESCVIGLCGGWSVAILLISAILVATLQGTFWDSWSTYRSWYMFRASFLISTYLWLWGCDLAVFESYQFNHAFIFGADPTTLLRVPHVWNVAAVVSVTTMLFTIFYILAFLYPNIFIIDPEIFSVMMLFCWMIYVAVPFPWLKYTRRFLFRSFFKQIISPFSTVEFIDFFLADQWTSLFTLVIDLAFSFCYLFTLDFLEDGDYHSQCDSISLKAGLSVLKITPYWIRFWQCIRRANDQIKNPNGTNKKSLKKHLMNAGKYSCAIITVIVGAIHVYYDTPTTLVVAVIGGVIATIYAYLWDIIKDWGLLENISKHKYLRKEITYPRTSYYIAMILNLIFRLAWAISLFPASFGINISMHYIALPLNMAEVVRRCMWNLFRVENEHLNNCGEFRVVKDVPMIPSFENDDKKDKQDDDNDNNDDKEIEIIKHKPPHSKAKSSIEFTDHDKSNKNIKIQHGNDKLDDDIMNASSSNIDKNQMKIPSHSIPDDSPTYSNGDQNINIIVLNTIDNDDDNDNGHHDKVRNSITSDKLTKEPSDRNSVNLEHSDSNKNIKNTNNNNNNNPTDNLTSKSPMKRPIKVHYSPGYSPRPTTPQNLETKNKKHPQYSRNRQNSWDNAEHQKHLKDNNNKPPYTKVKTFFPHKNKYSTVLDNNASSSSSSSSPLSNESSDDNRNINDKYNKNKKYYHIKSAKSANLINLPHYFDDDDHGELKINEQQFAYNDNNDLEGFDVDDINAMKKKKKKRKKKKRKFQRKPNKQVISLRPQALTPDANTYDKQNKHNLFDGIDDDNDQIRQLQPKKKKKKKKIKIKRIKTDDTISSTPSSFRKNKHRKAKTAYSGNGGLNLYYKSKSEQNMKKKSPNFVRKRKHKRKIYANDNDNTDDAPIIEQHDVNPQHVILRKTDNNSSCTSNDQQLTPNIKIINKLQPINTTTTTTKSNINDPSQSEIYSEDSEISESRTKSTTQTWPKSKWKAENQDNKPQIADLTKENLQKLNSEKQDIDIDINDVSLVIPTTNININKQKKKKQIETKKKKKKKKKKIKKKKIPLNVDTNDHKSKSRSKSLDNININIGISQNNDEEEEEKMIKVKPSKSQQNIDNMNNISSDGTGRQTPITRMHGRRKVRQHSLSRTSQHSIGLLSNNSSDYLFDQNDDNNNNKNVKNDNL